MEKELVKPVNSKNLLRTWYEPLEKWGCIDLFDGLVRDLDLVYELSVVFPKKSQIFRAFKETPYDECKVVLLGQDPYHNVYNNKPSACGLAFVTENGYHNPSLKRMIQELDKDLDIPKEKQYNYNRIKNWSKEGVLMLNTSLTVEYGNPGSHLNVWEEWTKRLIYGLSEDRPDIVWILLGAKAQNYKIHMPESVLTVEASHPSPFTGDKWWGSKIYSRTNELLKELNKSEVKW